MTTLHLSPSECHERLLRRPGSLAFRGQALGPWRRALRAALRGSLGLDRMPAPGPLRVRRLWRRELPQGTVEKLVFRAEPGADVPAYACVPRGVRGPLPWMICLQGHSTGMHNSIGLDAGEQAAIAVEGDRDFALGCLERGVAALAIEQRSLGERQERKQQRVSYHNACHDGAMRALMLGRTLLGERVYDVARGLDYLATRRDVAPGRVGVMGNSGGGTVACYAAALLPQLQFLMASCCFCTYRDSILSIHHCADNYVPGLAALADFPDIVGLFAPRPAVIVAGERDPIFPLPGVQAAHRKLRRIYRAAGAPEACPLVVGGEGHRFYAELGWREALRLGPWR
jgi:dienelactone hydrolase